MASRLAGKVAFITGGSGGIGEGIARNFIAQGATVIISGIDEERLNQTAASLGCAAYVQDVSDEARWNEIVPEIVSRHGRLDILVNNAGIVGSMEHVTPEDTQLDDFQRIVSVNLLGTFLGCRTAIPVMRAGGGGSIVNISSITATIGTPTQTAYGPTKAGVVQLTMSVAAHGAKDQIRCNAIHPGQTRTPMLDTLLDGIAGRMGLESGQAAEKMLESMVPVGFIGSPDDIAHAAVYLASDESRYVTGTSLVVDGGLTLVV